MSGITELRKTYLFEYLEKTDLFETANTNKRDFLNFRFIYMQDQVLNWMPIILRFVQKL